MKCSCFKDVLWLQDFVLKLRQNILKWARHSILKFSPTLPHLRLLPTYDVFRHFELPMYSRLQCITSPTLCYLMHRQHPVMLQNQTLILSFLILYTKKSFLRAYEFFEISFFENSYEIFYEKIVFKILSSWSFFPF